MSNQNEPTKGGALPSVPLQPIVGLWIDAAVELPEPKRRVLVFTEHYAKTGSFSPFQFGRHTAEYGWRVDGEKRSVRVTHWAKPVKPNAGIERPQKPQGGLLP